MLFRGRPQVTSRTVKAAHPDKKVTLVHAHDRLHSSLFQPGLHASLMRQLGKLGVDVHLNTRPKLDIDQSGKLAPRTFDLGNGKTVEACVCFLVLTGGADDGTATSSSSLPAPSPTATSSASSILRSSTRTVRSRSRRRCKSIRTTRPTLASSRLAMSRTARTSSWLVCTALSFWERS